MGLFDRLKQRLIPEAERGKNKDPSLDLASGKEASVYGKTHSINASERHKQVNLLTPREYDLYLLLLEGYTLKESGKQLAIKYSTANTHMTAIYKKLGVNSRAELIINYRGINKENISAP